MMILLRKKGWRVSLTVYQPRYENGELRSETTGRHFHRLWQSRKLHPLKHGSTGLLQIPKILQEFWERYCFFSDDRVLTLSNLEALQVGVVIDKSFTSAQSVSRTFQTVCSEPERFKLPIYIVLLAPRLHLHPLL
jgi:hypothetical protein